jgi:polyisoprenoid-binding protein YceI
MKIKQIIIGVILSSSAMSFIEKGTEFKIDKQQTKVEWIGRKVTGKHSGNISVAEGNLVMEGQKIKGGTIIMDMTSITNTDLTDAGYNQKLIGHLKSDDFFSTEKFPTSTLIIKKARQTGKDKFSISGSLTIKGITNPVEFPATIATVGSQVKASAKIMVDRTKYSIKYGSGSFFDNLGDKAIDNLFELNVNLIAIK